MCANKNPVTMGQTHIHTTFLRPPILTFSPGFYSISDIIRYAQQGKLLLVLPEVNYVLQILSPGLSLAVCFAASCLGALLGIFRVLWLQRLMSHQWPCVWCPFMKLLSQHPRGTWFLLCTQAGVSWAEFRDTHGFWPLSNEQFDSDQPNLKLHEILLLCTTGTPGSVQ